MAQQYLGSIASRLGANVYETDEGNPHIVINQDAVRAGGIGPMLARICPAHVYTVEADGTVSAEWAACLECGTCLALAPEALSWHYPAGAMGIFYREG